MNRQLRGHRRVALLLASALCACFVLGVALVPPPGENSPSAVKKLYDPTDL